MQSYKKIVLILFCLLFAKHLIACKCDYLKTVTESVSYADLIFSGRVISVERTLDYKSKIVFSGDTSNSMHRVTHYPLRLIKIKVNTVYKGKLLGDTITILTGLNGASCGYDFKAGENYIVYGNSESYFSSNNYSLRAADASTCWVHSCSRTNFFSSGEEEEIRVNLK